jgi:hypothetical protein
MFSGNVDNLVLGTVNAPWKTALSADTLAHKIAHSDVQTSLAHVVTFYTEVAPDLVLAFAKLHRIDLSALIKTYQSVKTVTGEMNAILESVLGELAATAS